MLIFDKYPPKLWKILLQTTPFSYNFNLKKEWQPCIYIRTQQPQRMLFDWESKINLEFTDDLALSAKWWMPPQG